MEVLLVIVLVIGVVWFLASRGNRSEKSTTPQSRPRAKAAQNAKSVPAGAESGQANRARDVAPRRTAARQASVTDLTNAAADGDKVWTPRGQAVKVGGYHIETGWLYVGHHLRGANTHDSDPALIIPALPVDSRRPDHSGTQMGYWPSYSEISPASRAGYLAWLAGGRCAPAAPIGYVFLYFYGLERRVLVDAQHSTAASAEVSALLDEVRRLLSIYGDNYSFRRYANDLLGAGTLRAASRRYLSPPPVNDQKYSSELPMELRLGLGELTLDGKPIPADWAHAWLRWNPETRLRTPAWRCPEQFEQLFAAQYHNKFGDGMLIKPNKTKVAMSFSPASSGFGHGQIDISTDIPDVTALAARAKALQEIADSVCTALDPYSRLLGRNPEAAGTAAALALLPRGLDINGNADAEKVWAYAAATLADRDVAVIPATELIERWPGTSAAKLPKNEAVLLAQLLERRDFGMEPDPRFGGQPPKAGHSAVLFRRAEPHISAPSAAFTSATALLQLAAVIATADGKVSEHEEAMLRQHVIHGLHLTADEQRRLSAHLALVVAQPPTAAALRRRFAAFGEPDRHAAGELLIAVAGADGAITAEEITALSRMFRALDLDESELYSQLHSLAVPSSRDALAAARLPGAPAKGFAVPPPPAQAPTEQQRAATTPAGPTVVLDHALVAAKQQESTHVAAMLAEIFNDDDPADSASQPLAVSAQGDGDSPGSTSGSWPVGHLDAAHSRFARALMGQPQWSRAGIEELAEKHALLPDGALDAINETAIDASGEPLCEGSDPVVINGYAMEEMLR